MLFSTTMTKKVVVAIVDEYSFTILPFLKNVLIVVLYYT